MAGTFIKRCKVCDREYEVCISCEKNHSWKVHTDTQDHYYIFLALMEYQSNHDAKAAYNTLRKRGGNFRSTGEYTPGVQKLLAEIYDLGHRPSRADNSDTGIGPQSGEQTNYVTEIRQEQ